MVTGADGPVWYAGRPMGREVLYEMFYAKAPGQEKLRKTAQGRLNHLLSQGWHEMARETAGPDAFRIRFEREAGTRPLPPLRTKPEPPPRRTGRGGPGGRYGGPPGRRGGLWLLERPSRHAGLWSLRGGGQSAEPGWGGLRTKTPPARSRPAGR